MNVKKIAALLLTIALAFGLFACGQSGNNGSSNEKKEETTQESKEETAETASTDDSTVYTMRIGNTATYPSQPNVLMREFESKIEEASGGKIDVELYEASAFGGPNEMIQGLQNGSFQGVVIPIGFYASAAPGSAVADIPYLFEDTEEYYWVMNGDTPLFDAYMESQGIVIAGWLCEASGDIHTTSKKIETLDDFKGLQIRTYSSSVYQNYITSLGATPIIMGTGDIPLALQQGTIDGVQCGNTLSAPAKYGELCKYCLVDATFPVPIPVCLSRDFMNGLPDDLRQMVLDTFAEMIEDKGEIGYTYSKQYIEDCYVELEQQGCELVHASDELIADMKEASAGVLDTFLKEFPDMEAAYKEIQASVEAYRAG